VLVAFGTTTPLPSPLKGEDERIGYNEEIYCAIELVSAISSMRIPITRSNLLSKLQSPSRNNDFFVPSPKEDLGGGKDP
jgi:hypothetical protein